MDRRRDRWAKLAAVVIDPLLADVWGLAWSLEAAGRTGQKLDAHAAGLLRMAYLQGYRDALEEEDRGRVLRQLGCDIPPVKVPRRSARLPSRPRGPRGSSGR